MKLVNRRLAQLQCSTSGGCSQRSLTPYPPVMVAAAEKLTGAPKTVDHPSIAPAL